MQLFPAIDLRGGQVVRLTQGDYDRMTVYGQDPCAQARSFVAAGAKNLHVVDLDGAKDDTTANMQTIAEKLEKLQAQNVPAEAPKPEADGENQETHKVSLKK